MISVSSSKENSDNTKTTTTYFTGDMWKIKLNLHQLAYLFCENRFDMLQCQPFSPIHILHHSFKIFKVKKKKQKEAIIESNIYIYAISTRNGQRSEKTTCLLVPVERSSRSATTNNSNNHFKVYINTQLEMSRHTETEIQTHARISILLHANPFMILVNYTQ